MSHSTVVWAASQVHEMWPWNGWTADELQLQPNSREQHQFPDGSQYSFSTQ